MTTVHIATKRKVSGNRAADPSSGSWLSPQCLVSSTVKSRAPCRVLKEKPRTRGRMPQGIDSPASWSIKKQY